MGLQHPLGALASGDANAEHLLLPKSCAPTYWKQPYDVIDLTKESRVNVVRILDLQYIWRAGELLPVRINEDDAVSTKQQCREKNWIHVFLVSVALPGTCRLRMRARGGREREVEKGDFGLLWFWVWWLDDGV